LKIIWESTPIRFIRDMVSVYFDKHVARSAAELAYFLVLTFFPVMICVNAFLGMLNLNVSFLMQGIAPLLPGKVYTILADYFGYVSSIESPTLLLVGLSMTVMSASAALRSLINIMDDVYGKEIYKGFWEFLASLTYSILFLLTIYLSMVVVLTGSWFFHLLEHILPFRQLSHWIWMRYFVLFALVFLFILLVYRASAPRAHPRPPLYTGAFLASLALVVASMLFSFFISLSSRYSLVYGSLASVIILLVWLYLCGNILILGNVFNYVLYQRRKSHSHFPKEGNY
jgi:membrane protein